MKPEQIVQRFQMLKSKRKNIEAQWDDVERYVMPLRIGNNASPSTNEDNVDWERDEIYDTTAIYGAQVMSAAMHGSIVSQVLRWFQFSWRDKDLNKDPEARSWLDDAVDLMYAEIYDANFDPEVSSAFQDLVGPGNCCMTVEAESDDPETWQGLNFTCLPIKEVFFEQDHRGRLARLYRELDWTALQIVEKFVNDEFTIDKLPEDIRKEYTEPTSVDRTFKLVFCVYCRLDKYKNRGSTTVLAATERPYGAKYVLVEQKQEIGDELGYYDMPGYICRFEKTSGSMWGHGPGIIAAPTAKYVNSWMELEQMAIRKHLDPPSLVQERGLMSDLDQAPGAMILVRDINSSIRPYLSEGRIDFSKMNLKELRDMLRDLFKSDELKLKDSPAMSATEAQIRYELMNRVLGPTLARIQTDLLSPLLMRIFFIMLRAKQFRPMPEIVKQKKGQLKIDYSGPLMRAQRSDEAATLERFAGSVAALAKVWPDVRHEIKPGKIVRQMALKMSIVGEAMASEAEAAASLKAERDLQKSMMASQAMQEQGKGMKAMGEGQQALSAQPEQG